MANTSTTAALQQNNIPPQLLVFMLLQFMLIIVERIIYLYHSLRAKMVLQITFCLFLQLVVFVILPRTTALAFADNTVIIGWYFVSSVYLLVSAYQIRYAYPKCILRQSLTKSYTQTNNILFAIYSAIPFVYEIRTSLDWACTDTTFDLISWFKVSACLLPPSITLIVQLEDISNQLFTVMWYNVDRANDARPFGRKMPPKMKLFKGFLIALALILLIWFPLLIMVRAVPQNTCAHPRCSRCSTARRWRIQ